MDVPHGLLSHAAAYQLSSLSQQPTRNLRLIHHTKAGAKRADRRAGFIYSLE